MKCTPLFFLCSAALFAQQPDFTTGQAARAVIGQPTFTAADPNSSNTVIGAASGIAYGGNTLFVADANRFGGGPNNHRVLLFQNLSTMLPAPTAELQYNIKCPVCVGQASVVLGQPNFSTTTENILANQNNLRLPTAVASDGVHLAVADTNHNRILIWNRIPTSNNAPADVVVGQPNFTTSSVPSAGSAPSATTMSGPQGVWIQDGRLYVADTQFNRVMIWNHIPTQNNAPADVVLGAPNFTTKVETDLTKQDAAATASNMLNPVAVTADGSHVYVTDLGYNRILVWNRIPTSNGAAADVVIGQPDMTSSFANNAFTGIAASATTDTTKETPVLCTTSTGTDVNGNPTYPNVCNATLNWPRFALSDGTRLFVADGGNDRILEFAAIPTANGASADTILGQVGGTVDQATDDADSMNTPSSLAFDGTNLYVADPYNRRITVYSVAANKLPNQAVVNAASLNITANGSVAVGGDINSGDVLTITINSKDYTYKVVATDTIADVITNIVNTINTGTGDPNVFATVDLTDSAVVLTARKPGDEGNNISFGVTVSTNAKLQAAASDSFLSRGGSAARIAPGTLVTINGANLAAGIAAADMTQDQLPTDLGGVQVYFNGVRAPLLYVSPTQINSQIPWEFTDTTSINAFVRTVGPDGAVSVTTPVAVSVVDANPGVFAQDGTATPAIGVATHGSSSSMGVVSIDGAANAGDTATITIQDDRVYTYTVQSGDTKDTIRDNLVALVNADPEVTARAAGVFDRVILEARRQGPDGNTIKYTASAPDGAQVIMTALGQTLCCANVKGAPVTPQNPALPGEIIDVYATGLGLPNLNDSNTPLIVTGVKYPVGGPETQPRDAQFVSSLVGGSTGDVLSATLMPGGVGEFLVEIHLNSSLPTNPFTTLTIAQTQYVSSPVTIPVVSQATTQQ